MNSDLVNFVFELGGAFFAYKSLLELTRTCRVSGIAPGQIAFSALWALWCLPYYMGQEHYFSLFASTLRCFFTFLWTIFYVRIKLHKCKEILPAHFAACGEGNYQYCSQICLKRSNALLSEQ